MMLSIIVRGTLRALAQHVANGAHWIPVESLERSPCCGGTSG